MKKKVIFIIGPTAVGKSGVAFELAKKINGEIISADSMQVYKNMPIISSYPAKEWMQEIPHYQIGVLDQDKEYSAADFKKKAEALIKKIIKRKHIPIVVGGSGLYVKALIDGLFPVKSKDLKLREKLYKEAKKFGNMHLYKELISVDPEASKKIHPNDLRRVVRALEIYKTTKIPFSKHKPKTKGIGSLYDVRQFGLGMDRAGLYEKINRRVDEMFSEGLLDEAKKILKKKLSLTASGAISLKEIKGFLKKKHDLESAKELIKKNTRHFAKRQLTWFRPDKRIKWILTDGLTPSDAAEIIFKKFRGKSCGKSVTCSR